MPRTKKAVEQPCENSLCKKLSARIDKIEERLEAIEAKLFKKPVQEQTIQRVEAFNGETAPEPEDRMKMDYATKIQSMKNAIVILPPNFVVNGRHTRQNVEAVCGFKISEEMMDEAYQGYSHEA